MAGGSRIVISDEGITISTGGKIVYQAGQHKFEGGQKVVPPKIALPMFETPYSNKIDYIWDSNLKNKKEIFILDQNKNSLIKSKIDHLDHENNLSSLRFYTPQATEFIALGFNSSYVSVEQKRLDGENRDELLEEALFEDDDDVSTGDDF
jgi:type VI secretion system secreted protein VgrG